jgi:hypothetical protein
MGNKYDREPYATREEIEAEAERIVAHWKAQGYAEVKAWVEKVEVSNAHRGRKTYWTVRSNVVSLNRRLG